jgi:hypothetical protein
MNAVPDPFMPYSPSYSGGEDTAASSDTERETFNDRGRNATSAELRRLRSEVERLTLEAERKDCEIERLTLEAARKDNEATRLTREISRLTAELTRVSASTTIGHTIPNEAAIGGASLSQLLQLSPAELELLDHDIREMRKTVLDEPPTGAGEWVKSYLPRQMRDAMHRQGIRYEDGAGDNDISFPWTQYQNSKLSDDTRLLGLRNSRRGTAAKFASGSCDIIVACETLIALSRWRNIH